MTKLKIKKGDEVFIISGKDRGKKGKIIKVLTKRHRVIVDGLNMRKKNIRPKKAGEKGETVMLPFSMNISNVAFVCPSCSKPTRVGYKIVGGKKSRTCKKCSNVIA